MESHVASELIGGAFIILRSTVTRLGMGMQGDSLCVCVLAVQCAQDRLEMLLPGWKGLTGQERLLTRIAALLPNSHLFNRESCSWPFLGKKGTLGVILTKRWGVYGRIGWIW